MFVNYNRYCSNRFTINSAPILRITNNTDLKIFFILQYDSPSGLKTKRSSIFGRDFSDKISFSENAFNLAFNVLDAAPPTYAFICNRVLPECKSYYFCVVETPAGPECVEV